MPSRLSLGKLRLQSAGYTSVTTDFPVGKSHPSKGQKWTSPAVLKSTYRSHGIPLWVDFVTDPCTSKWKTDLAQRARISVTRLHSALPNRAVALPQSPSRTKST
jgi:hypothetical protein